jgi:hypothetical protein
MSQGGLDQTVHGHIRLSENPFLVEIEAEHSVQPADINGLVLTQHILPRAVGVAMEDAKWLLLFVA